MFRVVLVINNFSWFGKREFHTWLPAVPIIATLLKNNVDFSVLDANVNQWDFNETAEEIKKSNAEIVLISALSIDYQIQYHKLAELAKQALPNCKILMGGVYATVLPEKILKDKNVDYVMQGYAEDRLLRILHKIHQNNMNELMEEEGLGFLYKNQIYLIPFSHYLYEIKEIVMPDYSCLDIEKYFFLQSKYNAKNYSTECSEKRTVNIIASYGCTYNCFFCANKSLSKGRIVYRPIEHIMKEIDFFIRTHNIKQISFMDDNIAADKKRAKKLFKEIIKCNYNIEIQIGNLAIWDLDDELLLLIKEAGCTRIGFSVESGSQRVLSEVIRKPLQLKAIPDIVKKIRKLDIMMIADFIIGLPGETWDEIRQTMIYAYEMDVDLCNINIAVPYPKTDMYEYMRNNNLLGLDFSFDEKFFINGIIHTSQFTSSDLKILQAYEWERINMGNSKRKQRAMKVLRLSETDIDIYAHQMRQNAVRFIKKHG